MVNAYGGLNSTLFDGAGNWDKEYGFDFGLLYLYTMRSDFWIRTGAGIGQRNGDFVTGLNVNTAVDFTMLEMPVTALYAITHRWHVFGGLTLHIPIEDDDVDGAKSYVFDLPIGIRGLLFGPHSFEIVYEKGITKLATGNLDDFKVGTTTSFRYIYNFHYKK